MGKGNWRIGGKAKWVIWERERGEGGKHTNKNKEKAC